MSAGKVCLIWQSVPAVTDSGQSGTLATNVAAAKFVKEKERKRVKTLLVRGEKRRRPVCFRKACWPVTVKYVSDQATPPDTQTHTHTHKVSFILADKIKRSVPLPPPFLPLSRSRSLSVCCPRYKSHRSSMGADLWNREHTEGSRKEQCLGHTCTMAKSHSFA